VGSAEEGPKENRALKYGAAGALGLLLVAAGFLLANWIHQGSPHDAAAIRFAIDAPAGTSLSSLGQRTVAVSTDGLRMAIGASSSDGPRLYLRELNSASASPIRGAEGGVDPVFSPDGKWLAFFAGGKLKKVSLDGGTPVTLADNVVYAQGATWGADNNIYYEPSLNSGILRVGENGGAPEAVTKLQLDKGELGHISPVLLPGNTSLLYSVYSGGNTDDGTIVAQQLGSNDRKVLVAKGFDPRFLAPNHLLYVRAGALMSVTFDPKKLK